ncbi:MAG: hypothetical protein ACREGH_04190 [Minisyncoccia bacterium]
MKDEMPTNANKSGVYKTQDFESYAMWKALPSFLRGQPRQALEKLGLDEDITLSLLEIKTQAEFAKRFNIKDPATLTDWNKRIAKEGLISRMYEWARKLTPNVIWALYRTATKTGKAAEVKAWLEAVEGM